MFSHKTKYRNNTKLMSFLRVIPLHLENRRAPRKKSFSAGEGGRKEGNVNYIHLWISPPLKKGRKLVLTKKSMFSITAQAGEKNPRKSWLKIMLPPPVSVGLSTVIVTGRG